MKRSAILQVQHCTETELNGFFIKHAGSEVSSVLCSNQTGKGSMTEGIQDHIKLHSGLLTYLHI